MVNLTKVNSVLAKDEESSHHMAKDALKKCVFTALLIFWANCAPPAPPVFSWLWPVLRQTKCGQTLIYLTAWHFVFPIMVRPCYCSAETRWHQHLFGFLSKFSTQSLTDVKQFLQRKINRYNQQFMKESLCEDTDPITFAERCNELLFSYSAHNSSLSLLSQCKFY